jgi:hypothetical protein
MDKYLKVYVGRSCLVLTDYTVDKDKDYMIFGTADGHNIWVKNYLYAEEVEYVKEEVNK